MASAATLKITFRAGELAALTCVSTDTLRYYERKGVLPQPERSENGYRAYPLEAVARVHLVQNALVLGFTLNELAPILRAHDRGSVPCQKVRAIAEEKLCAMEERLRTLAALRDELAATLRVWDEKLSHTPAGERAHLLSGLEVSVTDEGGGKPPRTRKGTHHELTTLHTTKVTRA